MPRGTRTMYTEVQVSREAGCRERPCESGLRTGLQPLCRTVGARLERPTASAIAPASPKAPTFGALPRASLHSSAAVPDAPSRGPTFDEMMARYASYEVFAEIIRHRFKDASITLRELYSRLVFNILCGNTDDHARNHAALWDGEMLSLTPAYDICPQGRTGNEASQAMLITGSNRMSQIALCIEAATQFLLTQDEAADIAEYQKNIIKDNWHTVCDEASLSEVDKKLLWGRQFLNPYAFSE